MAHSLLSREFRHSSGRGHIIKCSMNVSLTNQEADVLSRYVAEALQDVTGVDPDSEEAKEVLERHEHSNLVPLYHTYLELVYQIESWKRRNGILKSAEARTKM